VKGAYGDIRSLVVLSRLNRGAEVIAVGRNEKKFDKYRNYLKSRND
jgi:hypothetical protein